MSMIFSFSRKVLSQIGFWCSAVILLINASVHAEEITYYHLDALGSTVAATDENGALLWKEAYWPYGERIRKEDGDTNELWYTGKPHEEAMGLSYFGARWYDPTIGRFMAIDPVGVDEGNIHSFNRYSYANNNPYKYVDPDGRMSTLRFLLNVSKAKKVSNAKPTVNTNKANSAGNAIKSELPIVKSAQPKIDNLAEKFGKSSNEIVSQGLKGKRFKDAGNNGNINVFSPRPDGKNGFVRLTLDPKGERVISAGLNKARDVKQGINKGRLSPID